MSGTDPDPGKDKPIDRTMAYRPEDAAPEPPQHNLPKIPGITLHCELARGGMGVVYSGRQDFLDRRVAVKLLSVELGGESFVQRFQREAKILAGIKHPNIVACHMAGQTDDGQSYLVMEFIDGPSLKKWITDHGAVPIKAALRTTRAVAQALGHAHTLGIIHRDVKPENILLETVTSTALDISFPFTPKVVDLGLARSASGSASLGLTSPGSVMGTPATMSPEQYDEPDSVDFRTDIYGLGCALYEMLVGKPAFRGKKLSDIVTRKRDPIPPDPCAENPDVPAAVGALVQSMLATNRDDRPRSYKELDEQLVALMDTMSSSSSRITRAPVADQDGDVTVIRRPTQKPEPPPTSPSKPPPAKTKGGAGLLRTAEIDFLAEGLGAPGAGAAPAFQTNPPSENPTLVQGRGRTQPPTPGPTPTPEPTPAATPAPQPQPAPVAAKGRVGLIVAAAFGVAVLAGGAYALFKPGPGIVDPKPEPKPEPKPPQPDPPPPTNRPPAPTIQGQRLAKLGESFTLEAAANDPDDSEASYSWVVPDNLVSVRGTTTNRQIKLEFFDGLPGVECEIAVDVRDGKNPAVRAVHKVVVGECPVSRPAANFLNRPEWHLDSTEAGAFGWRQIFDKDNTVSCTAGRARRQMHTSLGDESYWEWFGTIQSDNDANTGYAKVGLQFEFGDQGWSVACQRSGENGAQWTVQVQEILRSGEKWTELSMDSAPPMTWTEVEDTDDEYSATFSVQRRGNKLILQVGECRRPPDEKAAPVTTPGARVTVDLPENANSGQLTLFVDQGIGRFRLEKR